MSTQFTPDTVFAVANAAALAGWIALAASPARARWSARVRLATGRLLPLGFAIVYAGMLLWSPPSDGGGFGSIAEVRALFAVDHALTAGWIHYLAFDLFVGTWISQRAGELGIPHLAIVPVLVATFLFGPVGLLAFFVLRGVFRHRPGTRADGVGA